MIAPNTSLNGFSGMGTTGEQRVKQSRAGSLFMFENDGVDRPIYRTLKQGRRDRNVKCEIRFHIEPGQVIREVAPPF